MQNYIWSELTVVQQAALLARPAQAQSQQLNEQVEAIVAQVQTEGDKAVVALTQRFDSPNLTQLAYSEADRDRQAALLDSKTREAIDTAYGTIRAFHQAQQPQDVTIETAPGVICSQRFHALDAVGLYIPGGSAVLPSTALMLGVPAQLAGCQRRVLVSPPAADGELSPALMYVAQLCDITEIYRCGGAQAIAALAYGTESIDPVLKVFGPGNSFVTAAKQLVSQDPNGCAIDMPAGPSELMVLADDTANAEFVAADLLSQAEHGPDSQVLLVSTSMDLIAATQVAVERQLQQLPRQAIATQALQSSSLIYVADAAQMIAVCQAYAPEHLSVQLDTAAQLLPQLTNAGSIFMGHYTPESGGDYATGTNHVLPTYGFARNHSSLGLLDFYRRFTVQEVSPAGLQQLGEAVIQLAETEGLRAHARAVSIRLEQDS